MSYKTWYEKETLQSGEIKLHKSLEAIHALLVEDIQLVIDPQLNRSELDKITFDHKLPRIGISRPCVQRKQEI